MVRMEGISVSIEMVGRKEPPSLFCDCITPSCLSIYRNICICDALFHTRIRTCTHYSIYGLSYTRISAHQNAFVIAAQEGNLQIVQMLIDRGAEVDTPDKVSYCDCVEHVIDDENREDRVGR